MQSETHETLYRILADHADRVRGSLVATNPRTLAALAGEHRDLMERLYRAGKCQDPGLLELLEKTHKQLNRVTAEIRRQRDKLGRQLGMFGKQKKAAAAYTRNTAAS